MKPHWEKELVALFASAQNAGEVKELLDALCSPAERKTLAERWQIVKALLAGRTQRDVRDTLGVSIATVTRGAREIQYGRGTVQKLYGRLTKGDGKSSRPARLRQVA